MKKHICLNRPYSLSKFLPEWIFCISIILSVWTTWYVTGHFLDSDAASELILAKDLSQTGGILSPHWLYSTELRVLNTQLVYTPLFRFFNDWHIVRFLGALILQGLYILSFGFLIREAGMGKHVFFAGSALLLLPASVTYGRIVLYHCYYIPHIFLSYLTLGLLLGFAHKTSTKIWKVLMRAILLVVISFIGGLGGIRQLMITHAPILLILLVLTFLEDIHEADKSKAALFEKERFSFFAMEILSLIATLGGYWVNKNVLAQQYIFQSFDMTMLKLAPPEELEDVVYGFLHQFGFRIDVSLLTLTGILSVLGVLAAGYTVVISVKKLCCYQKETDVRSTVVTLYFLSYSVVMTAVFLITANTDSYYFPLYYSLCFPWAVPVLLEEGKNTSREYHIFNFKRVLSWGTVLILVANGLLNVSFFNGNTQRYQIYEGLTFADPHKAERMAPLAEALMDQGCDIGYATFWDGNILTEMTDGELYTINITCSPKSDGSLQLEYYDWLTLIRLRHAPKKAPFLILPIAAKEPFEASEYYPVCTLIYEDNLQCAYRIQDPEFFQAAITD